MRKGDILKGGNISQVYKAENTVRRLMKPESSRIQRLLMHLHEKQYPYSPRFLGVTNDGYEILSYLEGEAGNDPMQDYMWADECLEGIARMLKHYHEAVADFAFDATWKALDGTPLPYETICHNDFARYNLIFDPEEKKPVGIIDFDVAAPGPILWDIAYTLYTCTPLSRSYESTQLGVVYQRTQEDYEKIRRRVRLFFESYGILMPPELFETVQFRLRGLCQTIERKARDGDLAFQKMILEKHIEHYEMDIAFIKEHAQQWI